MDQFVITGGRRLTGRVSIKGSKNATLPLMAAALLTDRPVVLRDVPALADIMNMQRLLGELGCEATYTPAEELNSPGGVLRLHSVDESMSHARYDIVKTMRASICALGPMLARRGIARVSMPGGCAIGDRPVDLHLRGLEALGAEIGLDQGDIVARIPGARAGAGSGRLRGNRIFLGGPFGSTVLGTANVMSAATLAEGTTIIESAACEPEVVDLANLLNSMGAKVSGAGSPRIIVEGVEALGGTPGTGHRVIPDRIEAGTYLCAAAITNGDLTIENCPVDALLAVMDRLERVGVTVSADISKDPMRATARVTSSRVLQPVEVTTQPHPGFPTDVQAQLMALLTIADGNSVITERIYPERFLHVAELSRMGAKLLRQGPTVVVSGVKRLVGAPVMASDLRASACLVLAGLAAQGTTTISRVYHLDRGYERMEDRLRLLGAEIERVSTKSEAAVSAESAA
ncbi:MAG: UDP-N-acetylglucosamine 1-carboxyvinyltransferase [Phycisphaeraceae bacterium]|nr:UDP-N-acetylglucosamine 1-carboxyvinyltransferase [Phycisphaeraceae bacterium]